MDNATNNSFPGFSRRSLLKTGLIITGGALIPIACTTPSKSASTQTSSSNQQMSTRRKLGNNLEVSSIGIGVQNMSRTYQTTIPTRAEMLNIIRTAYDRGVTFYDAAEAYGPMKLKGYLVKVSHLSGTKL